MKLLIPRPRGTSVWACLSSFGGGLVAGDQTSLELDLQPRAHCYIGTQSSTKIYRGSAQKPSTHRTRAILQPKSLLVFAPDPVQPFSRSNYGQHQEFFLAPGASLVLIDSVCSGRRARGETWGFTHYSSAIKIEVNGRLIFLDSLRLDPADGPLSLPHRAGRFHALSTVVMVGAQLQAIIAQMLDRIGRSPVKPRSALVRSASPLPVGAVLRVAGECLEAVTDEVRLCLAACQDFLGDDPWSRKW